MLCRKTSNLSIRSLYHSDSVFRIVYCRFFELQCRVGWSVWKTFVNRSNNDSNTSLTRYTQTGWLLMFEALAYGLCTLFAHLL